MPDVISLKLLFQFQEAPDGKTRNWRLTAAIEVSVLKNMLSRLESNSDQPVVVSASMPSENMEVQFELFDQTKPLSALQFTQNLKDHAWTTNHLTLVKSGTPVG